jgi:uncharacterized tellurite resistance protein B-like protein
MGIFDKLKGKTESRFTPKAALVLGALTMVGADGHLDEQETSSIKRIARGDLIAYEEGFNRYKALDIAESLKLIATVLDNNQRLALIANLLDIAMADGVLAGGEQTLINLYLETFQLPEEQVNNIIDVMALKNDFSIFEHSSSGIAGFCSKCGSQIAAGARFCTGCGAQA